MASSVEFDESVNPESASQVPGNQRENFEVDGFEHDEHVYIADTLPLPRQVTLVGTLCTAMFTHQIGLENTLATVGVIGKSFGITNEGQLSWLVAGYGLTVGTFILVGGRLGDEYGSKRLFLVGMAWISLWSLVAGISVYSSPVLFIFCRVFQGIGPAMTLPNALAILGQSYSPGKKRNMAFACFGGTAPIGAVAGFTFGGLFALVWWPWIYWSQSVALACVAVFSAWAIPASRGGNAVAKPYSLRQKLDRLDIPGGLTGVTALVLFNFSWNQAVVVGWQQPYVYVCLLVGLVFAAAFFFIEVYWARHPLLPLAVFNADIAIISACTMTGWGCFGIWIFYLGQVALNIGGKTPIQIAAWFAPAIPSGLISAMAVGKLLHRIDASWIMVVGQVAYLAGSILAATFPPYSIYWTYYFFSVLIICVGMDTSFPSATIIFSNAVAPEYQGMGASIVMTIVNYSISLGLGFAGTVETNINHGGTTKADKLLGYRGALWTSVGLAGLGLLLSLFLVAKSRWIHRPKQ